MNKGLNPCLCGQENSIPCIDNEHMFYIKCPKCKRKTQKWTTIELAVDEWNSEIGKSKERNDDAFKT